MTEPKKTRKTIGQRINAVRTAVKYVQKDAAIQNYMAVTHDAVTAALRPALIDSGIISWPHLVEGRVVDTGTTSGKGASPVIRYEGLWEMHFACDDDLSEAIVFRQPGHGCDTGDKAPSKALSQATKNAYLKLFTIETGENEESREDMKPKPITDGQFEMLVELCTELGLPPDGTLTRLAQRIYKVDTIRDIFQHQLDDAISRISHKAKGGAEKP